MRSQKKQQGLVLFISLVVLLLMSIAAIGLMKTVDSGTSVAGNMAFRQSAVVAGDRGNEAALQWLQTYHDALAKDPTKDSVLFKDSLDDGYYATVPTAKISSDRDWFTNKDIWNKAKVTKAPGATKDADGQSNTVSYLIVRHCNVTGRPNMSACLVSNNEKPGKCGEGYSCNHDQQNQFSSGFRSVYYSIYVKVEGPRNTRTILHTMVAQRI